MATGKETVLQFGEGGFLRGFVDYFLHRMNEQGTYEGKAVVVQPIERGLTSVLMEQDCRYHLYIRGMENGETVSERTEIRSISRCVNPYEDYEAYLLLAENPELRIIVSNTTEAGIEYLGTEKLSDRPPKSFPAKLTAFLWRRYQLGLPGFILLPCELIDHNADYLREYVLRYAALWELPEAFSEWIRGENSFCNTLVDRITPGYPKDDPNLPALIEECGGDRMIDTTEPFALWVIEGDHEDEFPLQRSGLPVVWTADVSPYKKRKVRILNGTHTGMVPAALLYGLATVGEAMREPVVRGFIERLVTTEILPVLGDQNGNREFAESVFGRFENPFIQHRLQSIALNSVSKFRVRDLPTMLEYREKFGKNPPCLCFSLAALIAFYKKGTPDDDPEVTKKMREGEFRELLRDASLFGEDISVFADDAEVYYRRIMEEPKDRWFEFA
ncbi:MAG: tagaturonate reductase [Lachnospiraceae bacterium]|nr:tagaturonate reductase [Lachnospiraceae bacterium]